MGDITDLSSFRTLKKNKEETEETVEDILSKIQKNVFRMDEAEEKARAEISAKLKSDPNNVSLLEELLRITNGQPREEQKLILRILQSEPDNYNALISYAHLLERSQAYQQAEEGYERALTIQPNNTQGLGSLAAMYENIGELDKAIATYQRSLKIKENPVVRDHLARVYMQNKNYQKAIEQLESAKEILGTQEIDDDPKNIDSVLLISQIFPKLIRCYQETDEEEKSMDLIGKTVIEFPKINQYLRKINAAFKLL